MKNIDQRAKEETKTTTTRPLNVMIASAAEDTTLMTQVKSMEMGMKHFVLSERLNGPADIFALLHLSEAIADAEANAFVPAGDTSRIKNVLFSCC